MRRYQTAALNHPHLLQILSVGETEACFYYTMEVADNAGDESGYQPATLRRRIRPNARMNARAAAELVEKLAAAVRHLHAHGLAHNDVKPENVLFVNGEPKLSDVSLLNRRSDERPGAGTPAYLAPEGAADDVYALGKVLYELLCGRGAADFPSLPVELLEHPTAELAESLRLCNRVCHPNPSRRLQGIDALLPALAHIRGLAARRRRSRRRILLAVLALLVGGPSVAACLTREPAWQIEAVGRAGEVYTRFRFWNLAHTPAMPRAGGQVELRFDYTIAGAEGHQLVAGIRTKQQLLATFYDGIPGRAARAHARESRSRPRRLPATTRSMS
ncbi:Serine/threonine-protein kinase PrkC [Phycisphaerae bacterium RAS1]|nr:Serine/threonine-protein kinase PrkC [Phycisphaerae bacterium RAS1]